MRHRREARLWRKAQHDMQKAARRVEHVSLDLTTDGSVQPAVTRTGRISLRCSICGKVCFQDQKAAEEAVGKIPDPMNAYFSQRCGFWHLATQRAHKRPDGG